MRSRLKHIAEHALVELGVERFARNRHSDDVLVLAYHNILAKGVVSAGDRSLHLRVEDFAEQLDAIAATHDVVPLDSIASPGVAARPRVAISFDDAYKGALDAGIPELVKRGMPATIFVAPALLGTATWWDSLADSATGEIPHITRSQALSKYMGKRDAILSELANARGVNQTAVLPGIATLEDLEAAARQPGITFGSHTWSHPNLAACTQDEIESELDKPLAWLRDRFECTIPWLSYPYGMYDDRVERAARVAGYKGSFRIDGGWLDSNSFARSHSLNRLNIPSGVSIDGFRLRLAGLAAGR